ncbi:MAG: N-6 DNA methylase, partial [Actinomycetota bacterium]|nr:N-6 DNA methylase [Actinomycetota bacterium]
MGSERQLILDPRLPAGVIARAHGVAALLEAATADEPNPPDAEELLREIVAVGEARLDDHEGTRAAGAVYTPYEVAAELIDLVGVRRGEVVCDPAAGGGVFLIAAAEKLRSLGAELDELEVCLCGFDVDPPSVAVAQTVLQLWSRWRFGREGSFDGILVADALVPLGNAPAPAMDVVVGNPPFLGQMKSDTNRTASRTASLRRRFGDLVTPYIDDSALFLLAGSELVSRPGQTGRVCLIVPASTFGSTSAGPLRERLQADLGLRGVWLGGTGVFDGASVDVVAPVLGGGSEPPGRVWLARRGVPEQRRFVDGVGAEWQRVLAAAAGVPTVAPAGGRVLGERATVTADFRDAYYWLADRVVEEGGAGDGQMRLATVGLVDPLHFRHGSAEVRFAKRRFDRPVIGPTETAEAQDQLDQQYESWRKRRSVPKLLVATQTKVMECVVDPDGGLL